VPCLSSQAQHCDRASPQIPAGFELVESVQIGDGLGMLKHIHLVQVTMLRWPLSCDHPSSHCHRAVDAFVRQVSATGAAVQEVYVQESQARLGGGHHEMIAGGTPGPHAA
jgi:hypothetical protein